MNWKRHCVIKKSDNGGKPGAAWQDEGDFFAGRLLNCREEESTDSYEVTELKQIIAAFTEKLPERAREIFKMSREEHLSGKEIAERLNIAEKTVANQRTISLKNCGLL